MCGKRELAKFGRHDHFGRFCFFSAGQTSIIIMEAFSIHPEDHGIVGRFVDDMDVFLELPPESKFLNCVDPCQRIVPMKLSIGAVARTLGISAKTIRYYEDVGLVPPPNREGAGWLSAGRRVYEEPEIERLRFVREARQLDFGIDDIRQLLAEFETGPPCGCGARPLLKTLIERKLAEIRKAVAELENLRLEMESLHVRTLALEGKTPTELLKSGTPTLTDALFGKQSRA